MYTIISRLKNIESMLESLHYRGSFSSSRLEKLDYDSLMHIVSMFDIKTLLLNYYGGEDSFFHSMIKQDSTSVNKMKEYLKNLSIENLYKLKVHEKNNNLNQILGIDDKKLQQIQNYPQSLRKHLDQSLEKHQVNLTPDTWTNYEKASDEINVHG